MSSLEDHIVTEENLLAYANVCLDLAAKLPEVYMHRKKFDTLIIPSRGAVPFFCGMVYSLEKLNAVDQECEQFYNLLGTQSTLSRLLPENCPVAESGVHNKEVRVLLAPFTADLNIERACPGENNDDYVRKTREYWARVTAAMFKSPEDRGRDPYFRSFTKTVLRTIEQRPEVAEMYELFPQAKSTAIMDTVISGRAATDILTSFEQIALETGNADVVPHGFLIVDKNGKRMQPKFKHYLQSLVERGSADFFNAAHIVSEDKGASMLGMGAVVYPTVMKESRCFECDSREFFVGAGSWHPAYDLNGSCLRNFHAFMDLVYSAIDYKFAQAYCGDGDTQLSKFRTDLSKYTVYARQNRVFENTGILDLKRSHLHLNPQYHPSAAYETQSFVGHIAFDSESTQRITNTFWGLPGVFRTGNPLAPNVSAHAKPVQVK